MPEAKTTKAFNPLYALAAGVLAVMIIGLIMIEVLSLDPDMIKMSGGDKVRKGVITAVREDGIEIRDGANHSRTVYRPVIPVSEDKNPGLEFSFLAKAYASGDTLCFLTATAQGRTDFEVAYNFHQCGNAAVGTGKVLPGTHQYVSSLRGYSTVTLVGYKDGTRAGDKGKSQLEKNKFLLLLIDDSIVQLERATAYGFPDGRYRAEDIGKRFCMSRHDIVSVKFSDRMKPIGLWNSRNSGVYLWTCKAASMPGHQAYPEILE